MYVKFMDGPAPSLAPLDRSVGALIRQRRKAARVPLQVLSAKTGLSIGYLSQIERGISSASMRAIATIADGLGMDLSSLFPRTDTPEGDSGIVFRVEERHSLALDLEGVRKELLTPGGSAGGLRLFLISIAPGCHSGETFYSHSGEEAGTVLEGELELTVENETWILKTGDAFRFTSRRPHRWRNAGQGLCRVLWTNAN
jgi:transcriptional regulator with XRE-family HTH domain